MRRGSAAMTPPLHNHTREHGHGHRHENENRMHELGRGGRATLLRGRGIPCGNEGRADAQERVPPAGATRRAAWPFIAGAVGGLFAGCTVGGIGPNFFGA